jgi:hypothetical protein
MDMKILLSPFSDARRYRSCTASVYSRMLSHVMLTSFGQHFFEASIPLSVTIIMSQVGTIDKAVFFSVDLPAKRVLWNANLLR